MSTKSKEEKAAFVAEVISRGNFLRRIHVWPLAAEFNFEGWLDNFQSGDDRYIAAKILSSFLYYSKEHVNRMLYDAVGNAVALVLKRVGVVDKGAYKRKILYSYIPGENPNPTDSGPYFMRKLRDELHIHQNHTVTFEELKNRLLMSTERECVVFCDDFVGSGCQCVKALLDTKILHLNLSIYDLAMKKGHVLSYAPLIANQIGAQRIRLKMPNLIFTPVHELGRAYNLFDPACMCWDGDLELYQEGMSLLERIGNQLSLSQKPNAVVSMKGFGEQGLFIGFEHGIPDSDPAVFFYNQKGWIPLMRRYYERD